MTPPLWIDVVFGLMVAICQAFGVVFARPVIAAPEFGIVATVTILSSTTPVMILPFIWVRTRRMPHPAAWIGTVFVVLCTVLIAT